MIRLRAGASLLVAVGLLAGGCGKDEQPEAAESIRLATTTSTENSGLLDVLLPAFREQTGIEVRVLPMGTGKVLRTARDGNCDVVLVHAPEAEEQFVREGWGVNRRAVMHNDFVILGAAADPAGVKGTPRAAEAMKKIAEAKAPFVSRGDNSGTHKKEQALWRQAGLEPEGDWLKSVGKGMGESLVMADQMKAYVLADRGTYLKFRAKIDLAVLVEGDKMLHNPYGVIAVNPAKWPRVKKAAARKVIDFLCSDKARKLIAEHKVDGEVLFHPWPVPTSRPAGAGETEGR